MLLLLTLLILIPIFAYIWAKSHQPAYKLTILGVSFGAIAAPFSMGLYATFFIHYLGLVTGMLGLVLSMLHGTPGYEISVQLGLVPSHTVTTQSDNIIIAVISGVTWAVIYGVIGYFLDNYRNNRQSPNKSSNLTGEKDSPSS